MASRSSVRVTVAAALAVMVLVLGVLFARLSSTFGVDGDAVNEPPSGSAPAVPDLSSPVGSTPQTDQGNSVTGSLPPASSAPSPTGPPPSTTPPVSSPGTTPSVPDAGPGTTTVPPGVFPDPSSWPDSLPSLGEHELLDYVSEGEQRWLFAVPGNISLAGGRFVGALDRDGWQMTSMSTFNTATAVGELEGERVAVVLRKGDADIAQGWTYMEVVYIESVPAFSVPPSTSPEQSARSRS